MVLFLITVNGQKLLKTSQIHTMQYENANYFNKQLSSCTWADLEGACGYGHDVALSPKFFCPPLSEFSGSATDVDVIHLSIVVS